jgi:hypothetical protein
LNLLAAFTWSKNMVNADYPLNGGNSLFGLATPQDVANYRDVKGLSPNDVPMRFVTSYRPNISSSVPFRAAISGSTFNYTKDRYISPGFVTLPASFTFGTAARNYNLRGFASYNEDMALVKNFSIKERFRCELRWEAFNVLNRVVWGSPATNVSTTNFGAVSGQGNSPLVMPVGVKINY